ncbi:hypothetical protein RCXUPER_187 [Rhodobacter phage RcXuper]|nr:hypothetical protein RCXUPER_187 [Rhodobacter phage RcXuper]
MLRRWIEKWKAAQALERERNELAERLFAEARDSKVQVQVLVFIETGDQFMVEKEIRGWAHRCGLGDEFVHARKRAKEFFRDFAHHVSTRGYTTEEGGVLNQKVHYPPHMITKVKLESVVDL